MTDHLDCKSYNNTVSGKRKVAMTHYFLDSEIGSDLNDGSPDRPFQTVEKAQDAANAGDTINIRGVYKGMLAVTKSGLSFVGCDAWIGCTAYPDSVTVLYRDRIDRHIPYIECVAYPHDPSLKP